MYDEKQVPNVNKNKSKLLGLITIFMIIASWIIFLLIQIFNSKGHGISMLIISGTMLLLIVSTYKSYITQDLLQPIMIVNIFVFFIFVARPMHILWGDAILNDNHVFYIYNNLYGLGNINELPYNKSLIIGLIGLISIYIGYYTTFSSSGIKFGLIIKDFNYKPFLEGSKGVSRSIFWYRFFIMLAGLSCIIFFVRFGISANKFSALGMDFGTIDIIWIHIGTVALIFGFLIRGRLKIGSWFIIFLYCILVSVIAKRAYIVNLLLPILVISYYLRYKKVINIKLIFLVFGIIASVLIYGSIRSNAIGRNMSSLLIANILAEFSMFDMLLVSIRYENLYGRIFFGGYNYLSIFNGFLPSSIWPWKVNQFDHAHTAIIFRGLYGGAVPTSLLGSLYFNFSFIGLIIVSIIFGVLIRKIYIKMLRINSRISIGVYALFTTFLYDIIRVGDIGREIWSFFVYLGVFLIMSFFIKPNNKALRKKYDNA